MRLLRTLGSKWKERPGCGATSRRPPKIKNKKKIPKSEWGTIWGPEATSDWGSWLPYLAFTWVKLTVIVKGSKPGQWTVLRLRSKNNDISWLTATTSSTSMPVQEMPVLYFLMLSYQAIWVRRRNQSQSTEEFGDKKRTLHSSTMY